jgi:hypothetical protein
MRYIIVILLFLFSCKSTKKTAESIISKTETAEQVGTEQKTTTNKTEELTEMITEKTIVTSNVVKTDSGETIQVPISTTERTIQVFKKKAETTDEKINETIEKSINNDTLSEKLDRETVGQEASEIINAASKGVFQSIFGRSISIFLTGVGIILVSIIWFIFWRREKSSQ